MYNYFNSKSQGIRSCSRTANTRTSARVRVRVVKHPIIVERILFKFDGHILQIATSYMGYILNMFRHCVHACEHACAFGVNIQQKSRSYMSYLICVWMHVLIARTSIHSRICQARDGLRQCHPEDRGYIHEIVCLMTWVDPIQLTHKYSFV
jgi:hypothetical protein